MNRFTDPFLNYTGQYAPNLLGAIVALVVGILVAFLLAWLTRRLFARTNLDEKIARAVRGDRNTAGFDSARWLSRGVFWTVILIALLGFFTALGFTPITRPLSGAFDLAIGFLPRLLAAVALVVVAWIVASFLRLVVRRGLDALRVDERLAQRTAKPAVGMSSPLVGESGMPLATESAATVPTVPRISNALSQAVYWVTWLLFLPAILQALQLRGILDPIQGMVDKILAFLPNVFTAFLIIAVAYVVGRIVGGLVTSVLSAIGIDRLAERMGLTRASAAVGEKLETTPPRVVPSRVAGTLALVLIVLFASMEAFDVIAFDQLSMMVAEIIGLLGRVVLGLIIFAVGWALANYAAHTIRESNAQSANWLALTAKVAIIVLAGAMALRQMGLANEIINIGFGLLLGGIAAAVAIAFGVGARQVAGREVERFIDQQRARREAPVGEPGLQPH